jgi:hypothetical protein
MATHESDEALRGKEAEPMIDNLALGLSHGLMMLAAFLLLKRPDLDREPSPHDAPEKKRAPVEKPRRDA